MRRLGVIAASACTLGALALPASAGAIPIDLYYGIQSGKAICEGAGGEFHSKDSPLRYTCSRMGFVQTFAVAQQCLRNNGLVVLGTSAISGAPAPGITCYLTPPN